MNGVIANARPLWVGGLVTFLILAASCASTKPPIDKIARTEAAIKQAEQVGAQDYAPLEIREARKKLERARTMIEKEEFEKATRLAEQASVDAELAQITALSAKARKAVDELRKSIQILKEEIARNLEKKTGEGGGNR